MNFARTALCAVSLSIAAPAAAQSHTTETWRVEGNAAFSLRGTYTQGAHGMHSRLELDRVLPALPGNAPVIQHESNPAARAGSPRVVHDGDAVMATLVPISATAAAVITWSGGPHAEVAVMLADFALPATDAHAVRRVVLPRGAGAGTSPFAAVGCVRDGAVVVIWNEMSDTGMGGGASGYLARVALDGTIAEAPHTVEIPWSLAALASRGADGYWLAVRYDGAGPDQTRLCLVRLDAAAHPTEHPWWATRPAEVGDTQLVVVADGPVIVYATRQGVLASSSHEGGWGQEAHESRRLVAHGPFAAGTGAVPAGVLVPH